MCVCRTGSFHGGGWAGGWAQVFSEILNPQPTYTGTEAVGVLVVGVLPGLGQHAVVPVDVVGVEADGALLDVLLDRVAHLLGGQLHRGGGLLGDLADTVEEAVAGEQGDVVPGGDRGGALLVEDAVLQRLGGALQDRVGGGGGG